MIHTWWYDVVRLRSVNAPLATIQCLWCLTGTTIVRVDSVHVMMKNSNLGRECAAVESTPIIAIFGLGNLAYSSYFCGYQCSKKCLWLC